MAKPRKLIVILCSVGGLLAAVIFYINYSLYLAGIDQYQGISIGDNREAVLYHLGAPSSVFGDLEAVPSNLKNKFRDENGRPIPGPKLWSMSYQTDGKDPVNKMPENSTIIDFPGWGYEPETGKYSSKHVIRFDRNDIVVSVSCFAECDDFLGLRLGMTEDDAINLLGRPEMIEYQSTSKWLRYHRYGADIILTKGIISGFEKTKSANVSIQNYAALIWKNLLANGQP